MWTPIIGGVGGTALLAIIGWIFHLGNRVTVLEVQMTGFETLLNSKLEEINRRLSNIESKLE